MARYSGGPVTHRALTGPSVHPGSSAYRHDVLYTLQCVREVREKVDRTELETVRKARGMGISWTEIATSLGVSRQAAWERWHELED